MSRQRRTTKEEHAQKLKEAFAILTQGVEMVHYDTSRSKGKSTKLKKIVWMDSDILRLCVDVSRPTLADRAKGKIPSGVYMRDIAEVRRGSVSFDFRENPSPPAQDDQCLSLIATERTISLELPSKFARDWFFERLLLVAEDILTTEEKVERVQRRVSVSLTGPMMRAADGDAAQLLQRVLIRGVQVLHHHPCGLVYRSLLTLDEESGRLISTPVDRTFFGFPLAKPMGMRLNDMVEIRPGTHAFGFVGTKSTDKHQECISLIGSECALDLQMSNMKARDVFADKLRNLLLHMQSTEASIALTAF